MSTTRLLNNLRAGGEYIHERHQAITNTVDNAIVNAYDNTVGTLIENAANRINEALPGLKYIRASSGLTSMSREPRTIKPFTEVQKISAGVTAAVSMASMSHLLASSMADSGLGNGGLIIAAGITLWACEIMEKLDNSFPSDFSAEVGEAFNTSPRP